MDWQHGSGEVGVQHAAAGGRCMEGIKWFWLPKTTMGGKGGVVCHSTLKCEAVLTHPPTAFFPSPPSLRSLQDLLQEGHHPLLRVPGLVRGRRHAVRRLHRRHHLRVPGVPRISSSSSGSWCGWWWSSSRTAVAAGGSSSWQPLRGRWSGLVIGQQ